MKKFILFLPVLLAFVALPYHLDAQSCCQGAEASVKKTCSVSASEKPKPESLQVPVSPGEASQDKSFSLVSAKPVLHLYSSLFASGIAALLSLVESCDPACCDPADCDPSQCDPADCLPLCEKK
jgi:hypothetical protein